ncbi:MAG: hypothetical protein HY851_04850 [candidate division Zixibacteria bacterium]|nr:hypothetical protein [candidate division Zixibacteria bacterium]
MTETLSDIVTRNALVHLVALLAGSLFLLVTGLRALRRENPEGFLYLTLALFLFLVHVFYISNFPDDSPVINPFADWSAWNWLVVLGAPSLILLYLTLGTYHLLALRVRQGIYGLFFGLTLLCFVYMIGGQWPTDVKGAVTLTWGTVWFNWELNPTL